MRTRHQCFFLVGEGGPEVDIRNSKSGLIRQVLKMNADFDSGATSGPPEGFFVFCGGLFSDDIFLPSGPDHCFLSLITILPSAIRWTDKVTRFQQPFQTPPRTWFVNDGICASLGRV